MPPFLPASLPAALPAAPRILVVRFTSLGDVVKCTALPRLIRRRWPDARITFLTAEANLPLVRDNPHLERALAFERKGGLRGLLALARQLRGEHYHLVVDVHRSLRSRILTALLRVPRTTYSKRTLQRLLLIRGGINTYPGGDGRRLGKERDFLAGLRPHGVEDDGAGTEIHLTALEAGGDWRGPFRADLERLEAWRKAGRPVLGLAPIAAWALKRWPTGHARQLLERFTAQTGGGVLLFGGPGDTDAAGLADGLAAGQQSSVINLVGRTTHLESAWFAARCDLMLSNDTGMSHIAEAVGVNALVLFGPTSRELGYFPVRPGSRVLERPLRCRPCTPTGKGRCSHPWPQACMEAITPAAVLQAVLEMLPQRPTRSG